MRIAVDGRVLGHHFPGIGRHLHGLLAALPALADGHELELLIDQTTARERWGSSERPGFHCLPASLPPGRLPRPPRRLLRRRGCDLFHATHFASASPRLPGRRVVSLYDLIPLEHPRTLASPVHRLVYRWQLRRAIDSAHHLVVLTEAVRRELTDRLGVTPRRVTVTGSAVDPALTGFAPSDLARVRQRYGLGERYLLHVGSPRPHKNRAGLLAAWQELAPRHPQVGLVLVGPGASRGGRAAPGDGAPRIHRLGVVPESDLGALYAGAEIYAHPARAEGFGLPVLEAMACGTAVCCTRIPALTEVTGGAARLVDLREAGGLVRDLDDLLRSPERRRELAVRGRERSRDFTWPAVARRTWEAYVGALEPHRGRQPG